MSPKSLFKGFLNTSCLCSHLQTGDGEVSDEADHLRVVFHFDQFPQLIVALQPRQQPAELVVVIGVWQTLERKHEEGNIENVKSTEQRY